MLCVLILYVSIRSTLCISIVCVSGQRLICNVSVLNCVTVLFVRAAFCVRVSTVFRVSSHCLVRQVSVLCFMSVFCVSCQCFVCQINGFVRYGFISQVRALRVTSVLWMLILCVRGQKEEMSFFFVGVRSEKEREKLRSFFVCEVRKRRWNLSLCVRSEKERERRWGLSLCVRSERGDEVFLCVWG